MQCQAEGGDGLGGGMNRKLGEDARGGGGGGMLGQRIAERLLVGRRSVKAYGNRDVGGRGSLEEVVDPASDDSPRPGVNESWSAYLQDVPLGSSRASMTPLEWVTSRYLSNEELHVHLENFVDRCGNIARLVKIGESVQGRPLEALEMSNTLSSGTKDGKPHVKLVGGIHGDETLGRVLTVGIAEWLCENYATDDLAAEIVDGTHLWLLPAMNPDGFHARTRRNANGKDLNRDFPDRFDAGGMSSSKYGRQPETVAVMKWTEKYPFVSSLAFHGGALVVSYPYDGTADGSYVYAKSPDDTTFRYLSRVYAKNHRVLSGFRQRQFPGGITNGAEWYTIYGGMGDWNYLMEDCMELTVEVGDKWPSTTSLPELNEDNREAILKFIEASALRALHGRVRTRNSNGSKRGLKKVTVQVNGIDHTTKTQNMGYFTRPLFPGVYTVKFKRTGYNTKKKTVTVGEDRNLNNKLLKVELKKKKKKS